DAWARERILSYIQKGSGEEFHPDLAHAFLRMLAQWETRIAELSHEDEPLPLAEGRAPELSMKDVDWGRDFDWAEVVQDVPENGQGERG
ncbi:MAG: hypothetical protein ACWGSQ_05230, partial [Longimicrobiales bacterium]